jgi:hypothetical protein
VIGNYESQGCCHANIAWALSLRSALSLQDGDAAAAGADAARARELAPPHDSVSFSRFTAYAWFAQGGVHEAARRPREARDAFAIAAVHFAGALGEQHADTLRARDAISRVETQLDN